MKSTLYSINRNDFFKGLIIAIGTPILPILMLSINQGELVFNWKLIGVTAIGAFITYMAKNFLTDSTKEAVKVLADQNVTIIEGPAVSSDASKSHTNITVFPHGKKSI